MNPVEIDTRWQHCDNETMVMLRSSYPIFAIRSDGSREIIAYVVSQQIGLHIATIHNQQIEARLTHGNKESSKEASA